MLDNVLVVMDETLNDPFSRVEFSGHDWGGDWFFYSDFQ